MDHDKDWFVIVDLVPYVLTVQIVDPMAIDCCERHSAASESNDSNSGGVLCRIDRKTIDLV